MNNIEQAKSRIETCEIFLKEAVNRIKTCELYLKEAKESLAKAQRYDPHKLNIEEIQEIMYDSSGVKVSWSEAEHAYEIEFIPDGPVIQFYAWETIRNLMKKYKLHGIKQNCDENVVVYVRKL